MPTYNYNALKDGSLYYDEPFVCRSSFFSTDPADPKRVIPKVPPCVDRRIEIRTLKCGRTRADWSCGQNVPSCSARVCNECTHPRG